GNGSIADNNGSVRALIVQISAVASPITAGASVIGERPRVKYPPIGVLRVVNTQILRALAGRAQVKPHRRLLCLRNLAKVVPRKVPFLEKTLLLHERQDLHTPGSPAAAGRLVDAAAWELSKRLMVIMGGQTHLLQVVGTLDPVRGLAHFLNRGEQQS